VESTTVKREGSNADRLGTNLLEKQRDEEPEHAVVSQ